MRRDGHLRDPRMSFELPRRSPQLRFADSSSAIASARPAPPPMLARARPKARPRGEIPRVPDRMPIMLPPPVPRGDVYALEPEPTEAFDGSGGVVIGRASRPSISDAETLMVDVTAARAAARAASHRPLPVPHFRSADAVARATPPSRPVASPRPPPRLPMAVWFVAAIVAGVVSYHFAPAALEHVEAAAGVLSR